MVTFEINRQNDLKEGYGEYYFISGARFFGFWNKGLENGEGTIVYEDFTEFHGMWVQGKKHGRGEVSLAGGNKIIEEYNNGKVVFRILAPNRQRKSMDEDSSIENNNCSSGGSNKSFMDFREGFQEFISMEKCSPLPHKWNLQQVTLFLRYIEFEKYHTSFMRYRIDGQKLLNLTDKDMNDIGICPKGHRMILRENILKLQKLDHLYQEKLKNCVQTVLPKTPKRARSQTNREEKMFNLLSKVNTILEVEEDGTSMTNISIHNDSWKASFHTISRSPQKKAHLGGGRHFGEGSLIRFPNRAPNKSRKLRALSAIETEIIKEYTSPLKAFDDCKKFNHGVRFHKFQIEEIDRFQSDRHQEMHEIISHVAQPSQCSIVIFVDFRRKK